MGAECDEHGVDLHGDTFSGLTCPVCDARDEADRLRGALSELDDPEQLAQMFHEAYERLAPGFGYETRADSRKPWAEVPEANRRLMTAVADEVVSSMARLVLNGQDASTRRPQCNRGGEHG